MVFLLIIGLQNKKPQNLGRMDWIRKKPVDHKAATCRNIEGA